MKYTKLMKMKMQITARFFGAREMRQVIVGPDNTIWVYDNVAGHYTLHHSLTHRESARIIRITRTHGVCVD